MKRTASLCLTFVLFLLTALLPIFAFADISLLSAPACYMTWAEMAYGEEVDREITTTRNAQDETVVSADKIATYSDPLTLDVNRISLLFLDMNETGTSRTYQTMNNKAKAFFCGIEAGNPLKLGTSEMIDWDNKAALFLYNGLYEYMNAHDDSLISGDYCPFYETEKGTYYIRLEVESGIMIYFSPKDQPSLASSETADAQSKNYSAETPDKSVESVTPDIMQIFQEQDEWKLRFQSETEIRMKEYYDTTLDDFSLTLNAETGGIKTMNIRFTWSVNNSEERTKKMLEMFSDDLAADLHSKYPDIAIERLFIFWSVPCHDKVGYAAKYQYASSGKNIYRQKELGSLYGVN